MTTVLRAPACDLCARKEQQIADLRRVIGQLQQQIRKRMGKRTMAIIDALEVNATGGGRPLTPIELATKLKGKEGILRQQLNALRKKGLVRRVGWRDIPNKERPDPEYALVGVREAASNGEKPRA